MTISPFGGRHARRMRFSAPNPIPGLQGFVIPTQVFEAQLSNGVDWTVIQPYMLIAQTIAQVSTRVLCGQELARNEEWIQMSVETAITVMRTGAKIREKFPPYLRWLAPYLLAEPKLSLANRKRAAEIVRPIYEKRMAGKGDGTGYGDGIQWFIAAADARTKRLQKLADEQLFLSIVSIHLTTALTVSILHDLADHRMCYEEIVDEIEKVQKEYGSKWTKESLAKLGKLDSFMKESQRVHPTVLGISAQNFPGENQASILRRSQSPSSEAP